MWLQELNPFFECDSKNWTLFCMWLTELNPSFQHDSKNWTFFFLNMTQRIEPSFQKWLKKIELSFRNMSQRIEYDSKNVFFLKKNHSNYRTFLWLKELSLVKNFDSRIFFTRTWLKDLNLVSKKDSKNLTSFYMTQRF